MIKRKASFTYDGIKEDSKEQKVPSPSNGKVDNSKGPLGYSHGVGEEDNNHGPGVQPHKEDLKGPGVGLGAAQVDNSPRPVKRGEGDEDAAHGPGIGL